MFSANSWHKTAIKFLFSCFSLFIILTAQTAWGEGILSGDDIDFELFVNDRFQFFNDFFNTGENKFDLDRNLHILYVKPYLNVLLAPYVRGVLELESELIVDLDRRDIDDDFDVRNAYIQTVLPGWEWITFSAGQQSFSTVNGLIYYDEAPAFRMQADVERGFEWPVKFQLIAAEIENDSPYIHADLKYNFSFLESVTFYFGWFRDTKSGVARIFNYLEGAKLYKSRGTVQWYGLSLKKFFGNAFLRATFIYERGNFSLRKKRTGTSRMQMRGYLLDLNLDYNFTDNFSASLFLYVSSGDDKPKKGTFRSFLSIDPYVDKTNIFFNGGIDGQYSSDNVGLNGIQVPGVITPGLTFDWRAGQNTFLKFIFAYLLTHTGTGGNGHVYGWEADFMGFYNLSDNLQLFVEYNLFDPGDYFKNLTSRRDHVSTEIMVGLNFFFNN